MADCPFCPANWPNLDVVEGNIGQDLFIIVRPLNPVTDGHVLVIGANHDAHAAADPSEAAELMFEAAGYIAAQKIEANIITSIGPAATQTVKHTHVHVVPRREGDGLHLPWSGQTGRLWFVLRNDFFANGGKVMSGPYTSRDDAFAARATLEEITNSNCLFIDSRAL